MIKTKARLAKFLNLSFIYVAGLTPPGHEVSVVDEFFEDFIEGFDGPVIVRFGKHDRLQFSRSHIPYLIEKRHHIPPY